MAKEKPGLLGRLLGRQPDTFPARSEPAVQRPPRVQVRRYKAAKSKGLAGGFGSLLGASPRQEVRQDLRGLINHARHAAQNMDHAQSYERLVRRHAVGPRGIALEMRAKNPDGQPDRLGNKAFESAWRKWGKRGTCTTCGKMSWWQLENVAATMLAREGNFLLREWRGRDFGPFRYQVQPLSIDLLDVDLVQTLKGGRYIDGGVEFNEFGRPLAFYFFDGHPMEAHTGRHRQRVRVPADEVIHAFRQEETGQTLGVPEGHTALRRLNMLHRYEESALEAAHYGAAAMVFLEQTDPEGAPAPAPNADPDQEEIPEEIEGGTIATLPPGYKATPNPSNYPDANMPGFIKALLRGAASALGVSYPTLASDLEGVSMSALRHGRAEEKDEWQMFQRDLAETLHDPIFRSWSEMALLTGQVVLPTGRPIPSTRLDKFQDAAGWRGRGWESVNPKDDATADEKHLANRTKAPSDIVAARGEDFEDVVARWRQDLEVLKSAGVPVSAVLAGNPPPSPPDLGGGGADPETE